MEKYFPKRLNSRQTHTHIHTTTRRRIFEERENYQDDSDDAMRACIYVYVCMMSA